MVTDQKKSKDAIKNSITKEEWTENRVDYSGVYLFFSFDLVNSTLYKNQSADWSTVFSQFFSFCRDQVGEKIPGAKLWKMVGDEILFYKRISNISHLYEAPEQLSIVMEDSIKNLRKHSGVKGILSVKTTVWCAVLEDEEMILPGKQAVNVIIKNELLSGTVLDFLGPDIDIGFRVSKYAIQNILLVDSKLACLLTKLETSDLERNNISEKMRIVSYERLKGVWNDRPYPVVWYQKSWRALADMFIYDERFNSKIVDRILDSEGKTLQSSTFLTKVFQDLDKLDQVKSIKERVLKSSDIRDEENLPDIPREKLAELHLVAVCVNEDQDVLIAKRTKKDILPGLWEFGCAQLHIGKSFTESIQEDYKKDFSLELSFFDEFPEPIGHYFFDKGGRTVPGLIFVAKVKKKEVDLNAMDSEKHCHYKWVTPEKSMTLKKEDCVPEFHQRLTDALDYVREKTK